MPLTIAALIEAPRIPGDARLPCEPRRPCQPRRCVKDHHQKLSMPARQPHRLAQILRLAAVCAAMSAAACGQNTAAPEPDADASAAPVTPSLGVAGEPVHALNSDATWVDVLERSVSDTELGCVAETLDGSDLPADMLETAVYGSDPAAAQIFWPVISAPDGTLRWPGEIWRCLSPRSSAAVYLTAELKTLGKVANTAETLLVHPNDWACVADLAQDPELAAAAAEALHSTGQPATDSPASVFAAVDSIARPKIAACLPDTFIDWWVAPGLPVAVQARSCVQTLFADPDFARYAHVLFWPSTPLHGGGSVGGPPTNDYVFAAVVSWCMPEHATETVLVHLQAEAEAHIGQPADACTRQAVADTDALQEATNLAWGIWTWDGTDFASVALPDLQGSLSELVHNLAHTAVDACAAQIAS